MTSTMALRCPKCSGEMASYERSGINVEQCRECRGIFLDRGELERLVDAEGGAWVGPQPGVPAGARHAAPAPVPPASYPMPPAGYPMPPVARGDRDRGEYGSEWHSADDDRHRRDSYGRPSKKRSFLGELLEGFGE
jgi:uncharacterized protein